MPARRPLSSESLGTRIYWKVDDVRPAKY